ncbi:hypothetical protein DUNSADRAFT_7390, partial [Dunaliella salina]
MNEAAILSTTLAQRLAFLYPNGQVPGVSHAPLLELDIDGILEHPLWEGSIAGPTAHSGQQGPSSAHVHATSQTAPAIANGHQQSASLPPRPLAPLPSIQQSDQQVWAPPWVLKQLHLTQGSWVLVVRPPRRKPRQLQEGLPMHNFVHGPQTRSVVAQIWATPAANEKTANLNAEGAREEDASLEHSSPPLSTACPSPLPGMSLSPLAAFNLGLHHHALAPLILGQGVRPCEQQQQQQQGSHNPGFDFSTALNGKDEASGTSSTPRGSLKSWLGRAKLVPLNPSFLEQV